MRRDAKPWDKLPKGWTQKSLKKMWDSMTGDVKHKVTKCMKQMKGKVDDPGAFCASLADKVTGSTAWRGKGASEMDSKKRRVALELVRLAKQVAAEGEQE